MKSITKETYMWKHVKTLNEIWRQISFVKSEVADYDRELCRKLNEAEGLVSQVKYEIINRLPDDFEPY